MLRATFQALKATGISLKLSKCVFAAKQIEFLGFVLSEKGVKRQQRLTEAIEKFAKPTNKKEIRQFLGMFYRGFIPNFSEVAASLNNLTKDTVIFHWSKDCETAFKTLKQALVTAPILAFPKSRFFVTVFSLETVLTEQIAITNTTIKQSKRLRNKYEQKWIK